MSRNIIASLRQNDQLHGSLLLAAIELAHRTNGTNGHVFMSYSLLAAKCHQSRRTAIRHVHRLLDLGIIRCQRYWQANRRWGINKYVFQIRWKKPAQMNNGDTLPLTLPYLEEREKFGTVEEMKKGREKVLSWLTPESILWKLAKESA